MLVGQGVSAQNASAFSRRVPFYFKGLRDLSEVMCEECGWKEKRSKPVSGILLRPLRAMTVIPLGHASPHASSHLPADSVGHVVVCLFGVAPRRDCRVSPRTEPARLCGSDPRLTADGRYPLRCPVESRLSSAQPEVAQRPSGLLHGRYLTRASPGIGRKWLASS